nr:PREDICTED: glutathione S-transferase C-terminal domain-containing protein-like [Latimeria chalumnae]XP_014349516.1 PREDICTED: glutathione S-transferase C-terminal domain-containing protein-like [Latimeria chalumnae]|eukprot:XP_006005277.1 PREDICTED: glutathione S-transferase C-terminal domain-containing protein-like [Latimeria chalumnae]
MKNRTTGSGEESLYLDLSHKSEECTVPLHTSITLFLLSYCGSNSFSVFLVPARGCAGARPPRKGLPANVRTSLVSRQDLPAVVRSCCLPAVVDDTGTFCRAGLAVVLRHIVQRTCEGDPSRKDVSELLGFKRTCLKACAEVSQWTRLCEVSVPLAVENFLRQPEELSPAIPPAILHLEKKLGEPVRVHNDDKIRRQKLKQQAKGQKGEAAETAAAAAAASEAAAQKPGRKDDGLEVKSDNLELSTALSKLTVSAVPAVTSREPSHIRKVKTSQLPPLERVFAEGLYFTLADVVLLPCLHQFLVSLSKKQEELLGSLPLLSCWYQWVQEVPGVKRAAASCGIHFLSLPTFLPSPDAPSQSSSEPANEKKDGDEIPFVGGPRPTMTKLKERGIEARFSPHPWPNWTLDWDSLPAAVNPNEGKWCLLWPLCRLSRPR